MKRISFLSAILAVLFVAGTAFVKADPCPDDVQLYFAPNLDSPVVGERDKDWHCDENIITDCVYYEDPQNPGTFIPCEDGEYKVGPPDPTN